MSLTVHIHHSFTLRNDCEASMDLGAETLSVSRAVTDSTSLTIHHGWQSLLRTKLRMSHGTSMTLIVSKPQHPRCDAVCNISQFIFIVSRVPEIV